MPRWKPFEKVLIANRGEIALRAIRVCRALKIETVSVHSSADVASPHAWAADHTVRIGPPAARQSYLAADALIHVANATGCGAVYPGYGFLSENPEFAQRCENQGLAFIGPAAETIATMGDKARARRTAADLGVPVVPGSDRAFSDVEAAREAVDTIGYPLLIKARAGGGGRGMRVVEAPEGFDQAFADAGREAASAFGDGALYLERFFERVRHVEVQVLGDGSGGVRVFDERDCSLQRRHQKLIEESPSPVVSEPLRRKLLGAAARLAGGIGYRGAGTVEFILDPGTESFYFIEMNTRIQVEHPVTEMRTGLDLVAAQFRVALGEPLPEPVAQHGHALEFRINAEDSRRGFTPSPGRIARWRAPAGAGIRIDTAAGAGMAVAPFYDSMIAKVIVHDRDRAAALSRARAALEAFDVGGIETTAGFHRDMLDEPDFIENRIYTRWLEQEWAAGKQVNP